jgi:hypothetical protein
LLFPGFAEAFKSLGAEIQFLEPARTLPWNWKVIALVGVPIAAYFLKGVPLARTLDFLLFADFNQRVMTRVTRYTGIFKWRLPSSGPIFETWGGLLRWAKQGATGDRWKLDWIFEGPQLLEPFSWTILIGGNGIGKTQLARELARHLACRDRFGDSEAQPGLRHG